jgi:hypothetical protein
MGMLPLYQKNGTLEQGVAYTIQMGNISERQQEQTQSVSIRLKQSQLASKTQAASS